MCVTKKVGQYFFEFKSKKKISQCFIRKSQHIFDGFRLEQKNWIGIGMSGLIFLYTTWLIYFSWHVLINTSLFYKFSFLAVGVMLWYNFYKSYATNPGFLTCNMSLKIEVTPFFILEISISLYSLSYLCY
jgi:hypothetical protein